MERLTERVGENERTVVYVGEHKQYDGGDFPCEISDAAKREVLKRLAAYEDTGLEPEGIKNLKNGIIPDHWAELFKAECEGRLLVLPCKVWDTVYAISTLTCPWGHIPMIENGKAEVYAWMPRPLPAPPKGVE